MALELPQDIPRTAEPRCPYFGQCGGCALQDVPYEQQVQAKAEALRTLLGRDVPVVPSPRPYAYRHRMDFVVAFGKVGLRKRGSHRTVVDLHECHLVCDRVSRLLPDLHEWIAELGIQGYDYIRHRGDLRYIVARHAFSSDQLMLIAVTASQETAVAPLLDRLRERAESVVWSVNASRGDVSFGEVQATFGQQDIRQRIGDYTFVIGPNSFFQNNLLLIHEMFAEIASHAEGFAMDLYCGVGCIGIYCSGKVEKVLAVESAAESIQLAHVNAEINCVTNADFVAEDANRFLAFYRRRG